VQKPTGVREDGGDETKIMSSSYYIQPRCS